MIYEVIHENRGALKDAAPFILDRKQDLFLTFNNLPIGHFCVSIDNKNGRKIVVDIIDGVAKIPYSKLRIGLWYIDLLEINKENSVVKKIVCTPFVVSSLAAQTQGLYVYPDIDSVISRLFEVEKELEEIKAWKEETTPKIHEHNILV